MASLGGFRFNITGASGTLGVLGPQSSWRAYILPRGGYASQDSTGTLITFDTAAVASRFAANDWIQAGLSTDNIRQVSAVGGNSLSVSGSALTISENDRIFLIGSTQPTVSGGSATYTTPATVVRERDDDTSGIVSNSMVTSNADGLIQAFVATNYYDCIIQDGDRSNQGSIIDITVGAVEGISSSLDALFGASVTINGALGVTGWATFGSTVTMNAALGVTGWATFGSTVTLSSTLGVTGAATFAAAMTANGAATFGSTLTGNSVVSFPNSPRVRLFRDQNGQSLTTGTVQDVTWNQQLFDVGDMYSPAGSSSVITVPETGTYIFSAGALFSANNTGVRELRIVNGGSSPALNMVSQQVQGCSEASRATVLNVCTTFYAVSGNTFIVRAFQTSGTTLSMYGTSSGDVAFFSAAKIS